MPIANTPERRKVNVKLTPNEYVLSMATGVNKAESHPESTPRNKTSGVHSHCEGSVGEMMVCHDLEVNFDNSVTETGMYPGDTDIMVGDYLIDVKTVDSYNDPYLLVKKKLVEEGEADIYVNVRLDKSSKIPPRGEILGWVYSDWLENNAPCKRWPRDIMNYRMRWRGLDYMENLYELLEDSIGGEDTVRENTVEMIDHMDLDWIKRDKEGEYDNGNIEEFMDE